jgi:murein DD-endopeptidase MepM/ murein hydrolase activator NlpD
MTPLASAAAAAATISLLLGGISSTSPVAPGLRATRPVGTTLWAWPLSPRPWVVHGFRLGPTPYSPGHRGVDLAAATGAPVRAPADGVIRFAGTIAGRPVLSIDHGTAISSLEPVISQLHPADTVHRGQVVGTLEPPAPGATHCAPATCLHWGVRARGVYVDPLGMVGRPRPAVLLPLGHP